MRRADLLLAFGDKDEVDGHILARTANGVKGSEQRGLRTFLIDRAAAHDDFSEAGLVEQSGFEGRRRPLGGVSLLDVVHEIDRKSTRLNSSHGYISYAVFCLKKKKQTTITLALLRC